MSDGTDIPSKRPRFTDEQIRKAIMRRLAGESREAIAKSLRARSYLDIIGRAPKPEGRKRVKPSKLTDEDKAEILALMKFIRYPEIAELYGVKVATIDHFLRQIRPAGGWTKRPPKNGDLTDANKKDIIARWWKQETMEKIAASYEASSWTISSVIKLGVPEEDRKKRKRKKRGKLSEKQKQNAIKRRKNGDLLADIGKSYGVSVVTIHKITKEAAPPGGWPKRSGSLSEEQKQHAIELRKNGETLRAIAKLYNTSGNTVLNATKGAAPPGGWPKPRSRKKKPDQF